MRSDRQTILTWLVPGLLVLVACGRAKPPGLTIGGGGVAGGVDSGAAGAIGSAGSTVDAETAGTAGAAGTGGAAVVSDGGAPDDGARPDAPPPGSDLASTALPPYDGGIVSAINASNWDETTIHPFSKRRMLVRDEGDPHLALLDFGNPAPVVWKTVTDGPWGRGIQLIGDNQILGSRNDGYDVFDLTTGQITKTVNTFPNTTSAYRMANGETMLSHGGATSATAGASITLSFLDKTDKVSHTITYPGFGYVRMPRPTRNNTFLVPADTTLFEGDTAGNILWTATSAEWTHIWVPMLMLDGDVLLATCYGASLDVVDRSTHMVTKRYGTTALPMAQMIQPNEFTDLQILPNGNLITSNWKANGWGLGLSGIQVIEFNPAGDVVWFYKEDPAVFSAIQGVMVIDGMDPKFLHVQEISADGTWQPVIQTP